MMTVHQTAPPAAPRHDLAALVQFTPEILGELLGLPPGCYFDYVQARLDQPGVLQARIRGAGWAVLPGMLIPYVWPQVTRQHDEGGRVVRLVIDWGFPPKDAGRLKPAPNPCTCHTPSGPRHCPEHAETKEDSHGAR